MSYIFRQALWISDMILTLLILRNPNPCSSHKPNYTIENVCNTEWMLFSYYVSLLSLNNSDISETCNKVGSWTGALENFECICNGVWMEMGRLSTKSRNTLTFDPVFDNKEREEIFQMGRDRRAKEELRSDIRTKH